MVDQLNGITHIPFDEESEASLAKRKAKRRTTRLTRIDTTLHKAIKQDAKRDGITMLAWMREALRAKLDRGMTA
jgi:predicted HicB family RNase H-like nuclease